MPSLRLPPVAVLILLLFAAAPLSCFKVRGPGIIPPLEERGAGEWLVRKVEYRPIATGTGDTARQWTIVARFNLDEGEEGIAALEISAEVDGEPVPFTFEEDLLLLESASPPGLEPGVHEFLVGPSDNAARSFPTLRVRFETP